MSRKITPFVADYLPALMAQASALVSSEFHNIARSQRVSVGEWRVLATLSGNVPLSVGDIARITLTKQPTVTRIIDRMQTRGCLERAQSTNDRRQTLVQLTATGQALAESLIVHAQDHERRVLKPFGMSRARELKNILRKLIELHQAATD